MGHHGRPMSIRPTENGSIYSAPWAESGSTRPNDLALPFQVQASHGQGRIVAFGLSAVAALFLLGGAAMLATSKSAADQLTAGAAVILGVFLVCMAFSTWRRSRLGVLYTIHRQGVVDHHLSQADLRWDEVESIDIVRNQYAIIGVWFTMKGAPGALPWRLRHLGWLFQGKRELVTARHWRYVNLAGLRVSSSLVTELILKLVRQESPGVRLERNLLESLLGGGPRLA
jgi:hypothetical protein